MTMLDDPMAGVRYQDILDRDTREVPVTLRRQGRAEPGASTVEIDRYLSREFHELEKQRLWSRVWQMACREEELASVGDTVVYDICELSILLVRTGRDEIKGYLNACLHKGRQLREASGPALELRCSYHGFCWNLDGTIKDVPCPWDFPGVRDADLRLPEVRVGTWAGWVFVNPDLDCQQLEDYLGELPEHFERWRLEDRYKAAHVAHVFEVNWKVLQEAFMESYHVMATHPQLLIATGDANSQYDVFGNFSRAATPSAVPSPHLRWAPSEQEIIDSLTDRGVGDEPLVRLADGVTARATMAAMRRDSLRPALGERVDELADAEVLDSLYYTVFPNFHPWGGYSGVMYRFRPYGDRHDMSVMEIMLLAPCPPNEERPSPAPVHWLGVDDLWTEAPELGFLGKGVEQDSFNLPKVQAGLKTLRRSTPVVRLAEYQETKIRHFHRLLGEWLADE